MWHLLDVLLSIKSSEFKAFPNITSFDYLLTERLYKKRGLFFLPNISYYCANVGYTPLFMLRYINRIRETYLSFLGSSLSIAAKGLNTLLPFLMLELAVGEQNFRIRASSIFGRISLRTVGLNK